MVSIVRITDLDSMCDDNKQDDHAGSKASGGDDIIPITQHEAVVQQMELRHAAEMRQMRRRQLEKDFSALQQKCELEERVRTLQLSKAAATSALQGKVVELETMAAELTRTTDALKDKDMKLRTTAAQLASTTSALKDKKMEIAGLRMFVVWGLEMQYA